MKPRGKHSRGSTVLTYDLDGWVVEEYPDGTIKRLAPTGEFCAADFPSRFYPSRALERLIVYAGANGAGKRTLRDAAADPADVAVDADRIARQLNFGDPRGGFSRRAGSSAAVRPRPQGWAFAVSRTHAGRSSVLGRIRAASAPGTMSRCAMWLLNDTEKNIRRIDQRAAAGEHLIEPGTVRRRAAASPDNLPAALALADRAVLLDKSGRAHRRLLKVERCRIIFMIPDPPRWLSGMLPRIAAALVPR